MLSALNPVGHEHGQRQTCCQLSTENWKWGFIAHSRSRGCEEGREIHPAGPKPCIPAHSRKVSGSGHAALDQPLGQPHVGRLAQVVGAGLEGEAEQGHALPAVLGDGLEGALDVTVRSALRCAFQSIR